MTNFVTISGTDVQREYLIRALELLHRYKVLRAYTLSYAMFPQRAQSAALAAVQRVIANAVEQGYIDYYQEPGARRYYALTRRGAFYLRSIDAGYAARSSLAALELKNREHREWGTLIAIASEHRGMRGMSEPEIAGSLYSELVEYFSHVPDALTFDGEVAYWHEVETSRRSTTAAGRKSGTEKFTHLVHTLIDKRHLVRAGHECPVVLVVHTGSEKIEREIRRLIASALDSHEDVELCGETAEGFGAEVSRGAHRYDFRVIVNQLPSKPEQAWKEVLPWRGCPGQPAAELDEYLRHREPPAANGSL